MPKKAKMTDTELVSFLGRKINDSMNDQDGELSDTRTDNLNYYLGKPYGNERDGYSSYITREVLEAIEWAMPSIVRVFTAGDKVVSFDAVTRDDEKAADTETDVINHQLLKQNNGFETIYAWIKDALMYPNGYVKLWVDESEEVTTEKYQGLSEVELTLLLEDDESEIVEQDSELVYFDGQEIELFSVKVKRTTTKPRLNFEATPPEQVLVDSSLHSQDMDDADFICHRLPRTYTWLANNGYSQDKLDNIGQGEDYSFDDETTSRLYFEDEDPDAGDEQDDAMRQFWVHECYVKVDADGDGIAEGRRIIMIGDTIFENEEMDYQPFVSMSAILMSHKHTGLSLADLVKDIQLINSTLWRQLLDNTYRLNIRRKYVGEGALAEDGVTIDALLDTTAEFIPCRDPSMIREEVVQPIINDLLPVIMGISEQTQLRSGVAPSVALDPAVLQQATAGAVGMALDQASQRVEMITRVFAETGFKRVMRKAHRLNREYMDHELQLKLGDEWVDVNPSDWRDRTTVTVNVGLGFNDKAAKIQLLAQVLEYQKQALGLGMATPENVYSTLTDMIEAAGLGDVSKYFADPAKAAPQEPQPDPAMELVKGQLEVEQGKLQQAAQKNQLDSQKAQMDLQEKIAKFQRDQEHWSAEHELKRAEIELKAKEMMQKQYQHDQTMEAKLIDIQARIDASEAAKEIKEEQVEEKENELDKAAAMYLARGA